MTHAQVLNALVIAGGRLDKFTGLLVIVHSAGNICNGVQPLRLPRYEFEGF